MFMGIFFPLPLQKMTLPLALVALISAFGSSFQYGYNVSVINSPAPVSAPAWGGYSTWNTLEIEFLCESVGTALSSLCARDKDELRETDTS